MPEAQITASDFYERLGVERSASAVEVKRAYGLAIRKYPPEQYEHEFKRIREAYEVLSDPTSRSEYDLTQDEPTRRLIESGQEALNDEDWEGAIGAFKRVLVRHPNAHVARHLLGLAYHGQGNEPEAFQQFKRLTVEKPSSASYWTFRGVSATELEWWDDAESSFRRAIHLAPEDSEHSINLARVLRQQSRFDEARQVLEGAIHADGTVDYEDFGCFFELVTLELLQGRLDEVRAVTTRIESIIRDEFQATRSAFKFAKLAHELLELRAFPLASTVAEASQRLAPNNQQIASLTRVIRDSHAAVEQWQAAQNDKHLRPVTQLVLAVQLQSYFGAFEDELDEERLRSEMAEALLEENTIADLTTGHAGPTLREQLRYLKHTYPALAKLLPDPLRKFLSHATENAERVRLACPKCQNIAVATNMSAQLSCPSCGSAVRYERTGIGGQVRDIPAQQNELEHVKGCVLLIGAFLFLLFLLQSC